MPPLGDVEKCSCNRALTADLSIDRVVCVWDVASIQLLTAHVSSCTVFFPCMWSLRCLGGKGRGSALLCCAQNKLELSGLSLCWLTDRRPADYLCVSMGNGAVSLRRRPRGHPSVSWWEGVWYVSPPRQMDRKYSQRNNNICRIYIQKNVRA